MVPSDVDGGDTSKIKFRHVLRLHIVGPDNMEAPETIFMQWLLLLKQRWQLFAFVIF